MIVLIDFSNVLLDVGKWELDKNVISLLIELRKNSIPLFLFTNVPSRKIEIYEGEFDFKKYFDGIIHDDRYIKPDPRAYERLQEITGYRYNDMVFIDDSKENVEVAEGFGIKGIVYLGSKDLKLIV